MHSKIMQIAAVYSHKQGQEILEKNYPNHLSEVFSCIELVNAEACRTKTSREITMPGKQIYSPKALNQAYKALFREVGWQEQRISLETPINDSKWQHIGYREVDFVKDFIGVEVQFGKYAFLMYDIIAKMVIFHRRNLLQVGIEVVPMKSMTTSMSSGIGHFQQVVADLYHRGEADIDIPVMIIGIEP
jgi:hypothetical protein